MFLDVNRMVLIQLFHLLHTLYLYLYPDNQQCTTHTREFLRLLYCVTVQQIIYLQVVQMDRSVLLVLHRRLVPMV